MYGKLLNYHLAKKGEKYVAKNSHTLIEAIFDKKIDNVKAISIDDKIIGLVYFPVYNKTVWINRFMIDQRYQGYGKEAFNKLLKYIKTKYKPSNIYISSSNPIAIELYKKFGFIKKNNKQTKNFYNKHIETLLSYNV
jgi:diamine N-acetyltransferase